MGPALFFAPDYFSPDYFAPLALLQPTPDTPQTNGFRDRDVFDAISAALAATGEFADVILGELVEQGSFGADRIPLAVITPVEWEESDESDPITLLRRVTYRITLIVRDDDPRERFDTLDRLSCVVQNALDSSNLNGGCLPALTKIRQGRFDPSSLYPEQRLALQGEFSYIVDSSHSTKPWAF